MNESKYCSVFHSLRKFIFNKYAALGAASTVAAILYMPGFFGNGNSEQEAISQLDSTPAIRREILGPVENLYMGLNIEGYSYDVLETRHGFATGAEKVYVYFRKLDCPLDPEDRDVLLESRGTNAIVTVGGPVTNKDGDILCPDLLRIQPAYEQ